MKTAKVILLAVVGLLLLVDVGLHILTWNSNASYRVFAKQFKLETFHTNNVSVIGIVELKTGKPLLMDWDYGDDLNPGELSFFSEGTNVLNIYLRKDKSPTYRFIFHGPAKSETWWMNTGSESSFTERVSYDTNGNRSNFEVLYDNTWYPVDRRNEHNGIVVNGQWHQLEFTNDAAAIESATNQ